MDAIMITFKNMVLMFDTEGIKLQGNNSSLNYRLVISEIFNLPWKRGLVDCDTEN